MRGLKEQRAKSTKRRRSLLKKDPFIQVGSSKIIDKKSGKPVPCRYSDVPTDINGWVWDLKYIPIHFDMVNVKIKDKPRPVSAWFDGKNWIGLRLRPGNVIVGWKRNPYE